MNRKRQQINLHTRGSIWYTLHCFFYWVHRQISTVDIFTSHVKFTAFIVYQWIDIYSRSTFVLLRSIWSFSPWPWDFSWMSLSSSWRSFGFLRWFVVVFCFFGCRHRILWIGWQYAWDCLILAWWLRILCWRIFCLWFVFDVRWSWIDFGWCWWWFFYLMTEFRDFLKRFLSIFLFLRWFRREPLCSLSRHSLYYLSSHNVLSVSLCLSLPLCCCLCNWLWLRLTRA